jgi:hypothetical protein
MTLLSRHGQFRVGRQNEKPVGIPRRANRFLLLEGDKFDFIAGGGIMQQLTQLAISTESAKFAQAVICLGRK